MTDYIEPKLLILVPVLYLVGNGLKKSKLINDKYIPIILGAAGIMLCILYYMFTDTECISKSLFTAITQGILCAGASVYGNQIYKQLEKDK